MRVFIMCPAGFATGGTELLHQLSYVLSDMGVENYMVYPNRKKVECPTPERFMKYDVKYVTEYIDSKESVLVLPETMVQYVDCCKVGKVAIWWLSVNNYLITYSKLGNGRGYDYFGLYERNNVVHFVQSYYAELFLRTILKIKECYYLTDYISNDIVGVAQEKGKNNIRDNIVLYNPKKGFENVNPIMQKCRSDISWIPLQNMTPTEMAETMCRSKVYIDFGEHPGKDRIPREAAVCGCCIITNKLGSAAYQQDIDIPSLYKFDKMSEYDLILETIYDLIDNYSERTSYFEEYRAKVLREKDLFYNETREFISVLQSEVGAEINTPIKKETFETVTLIKDAAKQISQMVDSVLTAKEGAGKSETAKTMLVIDYILQIMRETIYAEFMYWEQDEEETMN